MAHSTTFEKLAQKLLFTKPNHISCEFNHEELFNLRDSIQKGLEIEDPDETYTNADKITSATVFLEEVLTADEAASLLEK